MTRFGGCVLALSACAAFVGCSPTPYVPQETQRTLIHSIGNESVLTFEKGRSLAIPIQGARPKGAEVRLVAQVFGTVPPDVSEYELKEIGWASGTAIDRDRVALQTIAIDLNTIGERIGVRTRDVDLLKARVKDAEEVSEKSLEDARTTLKDATKLHDQAIAVRTNAQKDLKDTDARISQLETAVTDASNRLEQARLAAATSAAPESDPTKRADLIAQATKVTEVTLNAAREELRLAKESRGPKRSAADAAETQERSAAQLLDGARNNEQKSLASMATRQTLDATRKQIADLETAIAQDVAIQKEKTQRQAALDKAIKDYEQSVKSRKALDAAGQPAGAPEFALQTEQSVKIDSFNAPGSAFPPLAVVLSSRYTDRLADGDRLRVQISYGGTAPEQKGQPIEARDDGRTVSRTFVLYSVDTYRTKKVPNIIPPYEIRAFPMPDEEAEYLFGKLIRDNYFVVRLSIRNIESQHDWIVNCGTISVSGQALVEPFGSQAGRFNVPVQVTPQSREHVYAVLDGQEPYTARSWVFRGLEFAGTLATAINAGFEGGAETARLLGLATGIAIPEGKKLWPDPWQGYRRNVVNYAMPNLLKINRQSTSTPYFLFFSKKDIQTLVLESSLFATRWSPIGTDSKGFKGPPAHVVYLTFDNMEIPFEVANDNDNLSARSGESLIADALDRDRTSAAARTDYETLRSLDAKATVKFTAFTDDEKKANLTHRENISTQLKRSEAAWMGTRTATSAAEAKSLAEIVKDALAKAKTAATSMGITD